MSLSSPAIKIFPSLLAADVLDLGHQIQRLLDINIDGIHIDVMDGQYVPNWAFGPKWVEAIARRWPKLVLDVHLMLVAPERNITAYIQAGAHRLAFHWEACVHPIRVLETIRTAGCRAGLALNPATPAETIRHALAYTDYVLLMSVDPGFTGQAYLPHIAEKLQFLATYRREQKLSFRIMVDGGMTNKQIPLMCHYGADEVVVGQYFFRQPDWATTLNTLREIEHAPA